MCEVISHVVLICIFVMITDVEQFFICPLAISMSSWDVSIQILCTFFNQFVLLLNYVSFYIFWMLAPYQMKNLQISSPIQ